MLGGGKLWRLGSIKSEVAPQATQEKNELSVSVQGEASSLRIKLGQDSIHRMRTQRKARSMQSLTDFVPVVKFSTFISSLINGVESVTKLHNELIQTNKFVHPNGTGAIEFETFHRMSKNMGLQINTSSLKSSAQLVLIQGSISVCIDGVEPVVDLLNQLRISPIVVCIPRPKGTPVWLLASRRRLNRVWWWLPLLRHRVACKWTW